MHKRNGQSYRTRTHTHAERIGCKFFLPHLPTRYHVCFRYTVHMSAQSCSQHRFCIILLSKYILICARQNFEKSKYVVTSSAVTGPAVHLSKENIRKIRARQAGHPFVPMSLRTSVCDKIRLSCGKHTLYYDMVSVYT